MSRKYMLVFAAILWSVAQVMSQQIVAAEYYWDDEPGLGSGNPITIASPSTDVDQAVSISTSGLSHGRHLLCIRTQDALGRWSPIKTSEVYVHQFTEAEYFWDEDPGQGNGNSLALSTTNDDVENNYNISTVSMKEGWHTLFVRARGVGNAWGIVSSEPVYIENKIVAAEYFWNHDPGVGNGTALDIGSQSNDLTFTDDVSTVGLDTTINVHYLVVRTMTMNGAWSVMVDTALFVGALGIEVLKNNGLSTAIYPNPASEYFNLSMFCTVGRNVQAILEDAYGNRLKTLSTGNFVGRKDIRFDLEGISSGIYFVHFISDKNEWTQRIMVTK